MLGINLEIPNLKNWKAVLLMSIILPVGLLATFKLTGIFREPLTIAETTTLKTIRWTFARPTQFFAINESLNSIYNNNDIEVNQKVFVWEYLPEREVWPTAQLNLGIEINLTLTSDRGFIENIHIDFKDFQPSEIVLLDTMLNPINLSLVKARSGKIASYMDLAGVNHSSEAYFNVTMLYWFLWTQSTQENNLDITFEITYFNGTAYKKIVQPFQLQLYVGYHYLKVDALIFDVGEVYVVVLVDAMEHHTPFHMVVSEGTHKIEFPQAIQTNSTTCKFYDFAIAYGNRQYDSPHSFMLTINITEDTHIIASYKVENE